MSTRVCILNYGSGNVKSVFNLFATLVSELCVSNEAGEIEAASHLVLPGVGAFGASMDRIKNTLPLDLLREQVFENRKPFLGICVGMQVLASRGEEFGVHEGLGWIPGVVSKLVVGDLPLPHIGWNNVKASRPSILLDHFDAEPDFYFVHSYAFRPERAEDATASCLYGEAFTSVIERDNIFGVQFHPEKSQRAGKQLIQNFLQVC